MDKNTEKLLKEHFKAGEYYEAKIKIKKGLISLFAKKCQEKNIIVAIIAHDEENLMLVSILVRIIDWDIFQTVLNEFKTYKNIH